MARKWSGFLPQNLLIKEEWELLEACEAHARRTEEMRAERNAERKAETRRPGVRARSSK